MTHRRLRILQLLVQREQRDIGKISAQIRGLREDEINQFDLVDRLDNLLAQCAPTDRKPISRGSMMTMQFLQKTMLTQRETVQTQLDGLRADRRRKTAQLVAHQQRKIILEEHADTVHRAISQMAASKADQPTTRSSSRR